MRGPIDRSRPVQAGVVGLEPVGECVDRLAHRCTQLTDDSRAGRRDSWATMSTTDVAEDRARSCERLCDDIGRYVRGEITANDFATLLRDIARTIGGDGESVHEPKTEGSACDASRSANMSQVACARTVLAALMQGMMAGSRMRMEETNFEVFDASSTWHTMRMCEENYGRGRVSDSDGGCESMPSLVDSDSGSMPGLGDSSDADSL